MLLTCESNQELLIVSTYIHSRSQKHSQMLQDVISACECTTSEQETTSNAIWNNLACFTLVKHLHTQMYMYIYVSGTVVSSGHIMHSLRSFLVVVLHPGKLTMWFTVCASHALSISLLHVQLLMTRLAAKLVE